MIMLNHISIDVLASVQASRSVIWPKEILLVFLGLIYLYKIYVFDEPGSSLLHLSLASHKRTSLYLCAGNGLNRATTLSR